MSEEPIERKGISLLLPQEIFEIMKEYKKISGVSYTNQLYNAIVWWLVNKGLLDLSYIREKSKEINEKANQMRNIPPEEIRFCEGDNCEFDPNTIEAIKSFKKD